MRTPFAFDAAVLNRLVGGDSPRFTVAGEIRIAHEPGFATLLVHRVTGLEFVVIPPGCHWIGSPATEPNRMQDEPLQGMWTLHRPILMARTEVTREAWVRGGGVSDVTGDAQHPADWMTWDEAQTWCARNGFRLPSEREWEAACRAGTRTAFWAGERPEEVLGAGENVRLSGGNLHPRVARVALGRSNPFGLFDMHGNVAEWTADARGGVWADLDRVAWPATDPRAEMFYADRVVRGGRYSGWAESSSRSSARQFMLPTFGFPDVGFRPVSDID